MLYKYKALKPYNLIILPNSLLGGLDLVIVPGVAFTVQGHRLGHGRGYYDKFLTKLSQTQPRPFITVALSLKEQIVDKVPVGSNDVVIDYILYDDS